MKLEEASVQVKEHGAGHDLWWLRWCFLNRAWEVFSYGAVLGVGDVVACPLPQSFVLIRWWTRSHIFLDEGHANHSLYKIAGECGIWPLYFVDEDWHVFCFEGKGLVIWYQERLLSLWRRQLRVKCLNLKYGWDLKQTWLQFFQLSHRAASPELVLQAREWTMSTHVLWTVMNKLRLSIKKKIFCIHHIGFFQS